MMQRFSILRSGWRGLSLVLGISLSAADLKVLPGGEIFLFGGASGKVPVTIENNSDETKSPVLQYRLFQASSATLAPLGEAVSLGNKQFPHGQAALLSIAVTAPDVRTITRFVLKISEDGNEIGSVNFDVCPPKLLSRLTALIDEIHVYESENLLLRLLEENGAKVSDATSQPETKPKLIIARLPNEEAERKWKDESNSSAPAFLIIVGRGVTGAERLLPVKVLDGPDNPRVAILQEWFVPDLKANPLSQLRLLRAIELLLQPGKERTPAAGKPAN